MSVFPLDSVVRLWTRSLQSLHTRETKDHLPFEIKVRVHPYHVELKKKKNLVILDDNKGRCLGSRLSVEGF